MDALCCQLNLVGPNKTNERSIPPEIVNAAAGLPTQPVQRGASSAGLLGIDSGMHVGAAAVGFYGEECAITSTVCDLPLFSEDECTRYL